MWNIVDSMEANITKLLDMVVVEEGTDVAEIDDKEPPPRPTPHGAIEATSSSSVWDFVMPGIPQISVAAQPL